MHTNTIIQASAQIVRITELKPGDVYKRVETAGYSGDTAKLVYGVVTDIMHNGDDGAICAIEIKRDLYAAGSVREQKVFTLNSDVAIYPATPEELSQWAIELQEEYDRKVTAAVEALDKARREEVLVRSLLNRAIGGELSSPTTAIGPATTEEESSDDAEAEPGTTEV